MMILILVLAFCALLIYHAVKHKKDTPSTGSSIKSGIEYSVESSAEFSNSVQRKGLEGENDIVWHLDNQSSFGLHGAIMQNLYIPKEDRGSAEIDVLFLTTKGLFVIESKNYAGYIFGNDQQKYWTVSLHVGGGLTEKHRFYNPVWQNKTHIRFLRRLLDASIPIYSLVVFSDRGEFKDISYFSDDVTILQVSGLEQFFLNVNDTWPDRITTEKLEELQAILTPYTQVSNETRQEHIHMILEEQAAPQSCPWCGGKLVKRTARKGPNAGGEFYGCSNFPKCRYTRSL